MRVLIVHKRFEVGTFWARSLAREGAEAIVVSNGCDAHKSLRFEHVDAVVLALDLDDNESFALSDYLALWFPDLPVIAISTGNLAVDSTIFDLVPNARAIMSMPLQLRDLSAVVEHYGPKKVALPALRRA